MIVLFLSFLGILLSLVILRFNPKNRFLALFYFLNSFYGAFNVSLFYFKIPSVSVILLVHFFPLFYLLGPSIYFYVRMELTKSYRLSRLDFLHFLPFIFCFLSIIPYFFQTIEYKYHVVDVFQQNNIIELKKINVLLFPLRYYLIVKNGILFGYLVYISIWFFSKKNEFKALLNKNKKQWLTLFILSLLIMNFIIVLFTFYFINILNQGREVSTYPMILIASILGSLLCFSIFFFPNVLYFEVKKQAEPRNKVSPEELKIQQIQESIQVYIDGNAFLSSDFSKSKIMSELKISDRLFTFYFNEYLGSSFTQWRSDLRIDYSYELVNNGYLSNHTIESLAQKVGFQSRNKFTEAFKKRKGINPSEVKK